jgi:hypothetical protein
MQSKKMKKETFFGERVIKCVYAPATTEKVFL